MDRIAAWTAAKNADAGPAVSDNVNWQTGIQADLHVERLRRVPLDMPAEVAHGVLTQAECRQLIANIPQDGPGHMSGERVSQLYRDRKLESRFLSHDVALAMELQKRLAAILPAELDGGKLYRVSPTFRFLHYMEGGRQGWHIDGREPGQPMWDDVAGGWIQSRLTLQVYLSSHGSDFRGGELVFGRPEIGGSFSVRHILEPQAGDVAIFYQERLFPKSAHPYELNHEAADVEDGHKYACRTMVEYIFADCEAARLANIRDDAKAGRSRRAGEHCPRSVAKPTSSGEPSVGPAKPLSSGEPSAGLRRPGRASSFPALPPSHARSRSCRKVSCNPRATPQAVTSDPHDTRLSLSKNQVPS
mmetsp:Transcript_132028/g.233532  ORF Transcript_132028/g.233532 Transcript_132028/m.233532 type:complete len:359 (-) Transcript_132028:141-1217(-)